MYNFQSNATKFDEVLGNRFEIDHPVNYFISITASPQRQIEMSEISQNSNFNARYPRILRVNIEIFQKNRTN